VNGKAVIASAFAGVSGSGVTSANPITNTDSVAHVYAVPAKLIATCTTRSDPTCASVSIGATLDTDRIGSYFVGAGAPIVSPSESSTVHRLSK